MLEECDAPEEFYYDAAQQAGLGVGLGLGLGLGLALELGGGHAPEHVAQRAERVDRPL